MELISWAICKSVFFCKSRGGIFSILSWLKIADLPSSHCSMQDPTRQWLIGVNNFKVSQSMSCMPTTALLAFAFLLALYLSCLNDLVCMYEVQWFLCYKEGYSLHSVCGRGSIPPPLVYSLILVLHHPDSAPVLMQEEPAMGSSVACFCLMTTCGLGSFRSYTIELECGWSYAWGFVSTDTTS